MSPAGARQAPPAGLAIPAVAREDLQHSADEFGREIELVSQRLRSRSALQELLPDIRIYHKAVTWALAYDEFFRSNEVDIARALLARGQVRLRELESENPSWIRATGLVVRGYTSRIDGSVQPYGLVVPGSWQPGSPRAHRLDVWLHGRDNSLTELKFIQDRQRSPGEFAPPDTFVLHPYGRYCNAFKFAGETDVFEALETVRRHYPIDEKRLAVRGFSMGGAGCWHLAAHHPGFWRAAAPGAGFAETPEYTGALSRESKAKPTWFEQRLWHLYDAADYALNLGNEFVVAYSGERDKQRQAAEVMARAMAPEGLELRHLIGPGVEHKYEPGTKRQLAEEFDRLMSSEQSRWACEAHLATWTLRYPKARWVTADRLGEHWQKARVDARVEGETDVIVRTTNVAALHLSPGEMDCPRSSGPVRVLLDGQAFVYRSWSAAGEAMTRGYELDSGKWRVRRAPSRSFPPAKQPGLQGPIDDAFMDGFLMVRPTSQSWHSQVGEWVEAELAHATNEWRAQFRGLVQVKEDTAVSAEDVRRHHLVLWGDPQSNLWVRRILPRLPLQWTRTHLRLGAKTFDSSQSIPVLIYPNPINPARYVVLNTGFTFCEAGAGSNARQTPKLPDFAVVDLRTPHRSRPSEGVQFAGFFGERWEVRP